MRPRDPQAVASVGQGCRTGRRAAAVFAAALLATGPVHTQLVDLACTPFLQPAVPLDLDPSDPAPVAADVNVDGLTDLLRLRRHEASTDLQAWLGDGTGAFSLHDSQTLDGVLTELQLGDLDGDGDIDLACIASATGVVVTLLGDGAGHFPQHQSYVAGSTLHEPRLADLDGDGTLDVAVIDRPHRDLLLLRGQGDGGLEMLGALHENISPNHLIAQDTDDDGLVDLAFGGCSSNCTIGLTWSLRRGAGGGAFLDPQPLPTEPNLLSIAFGDVDQDGHIDLVAGAGGPAAMLYPGLGAGNYSAPLVVGTPDPAQGKRAVELIDLDGDGWLDLVLENSLVTAHNEAGHFAPPMEWPVTGWPLSYLLNLELADIDADGLVDALQLFDYQDQLVLNRGLPGAAFEMPEWVVFPPVGRLGAMDAGDLDGDGRVDAVAVDVEGDGAYVALGVGGSGPRQVVTLPPGLGGPQAEPDDVALTDLDADGDLDIVVLSWPGIVSSDVLPFENDGQGEFTARPGSWAWWGMSLACGDLDEDGLPEVVVPAHGGNQVSILRNLGDMALAAPVLAPEAPGTATEPKTPFGCLLEDLDDDGRLDIVTCTENFGTVCVLFQEPDGTGFRPWQCYSGVSHNKYLATGDFDRNGHLDIVTAGYTGGLLMGDGIHLAAAMQVDFEFAPLATGDVDGDGTTDVVQASGLLTVSRGRKSVPWLDPPTSYGLAGSGVDVALVDLDGDDALDVLTLGYGAAVDGGVAGLCLQRNLCEPVWADLGASLGGTHGEHPALVPQGPLVSGTLWRLDVTGALPAATTYLFAGLSAGNLPFLGGTLVPAFGPPDGLWWSFLTNPLGAKTIVTAIPMPPGTPVFLQVWSADAGAPFGYSASAALSTFVH